MPVVNSGGNSPASGSSQLLGIWSKQDPIGSLPIVSRYNITPAVDSM